MPRPSEPYNWSQQFTNHYLTHCHLPIGHPTGTILLAELNWCESQSESYFRPTVNKAPIWGLRPDYYYCQTVSSFFMGGALSDERPGQSFTISVSPRQRIHSWVRVSWDWQPFLLSQIRKFLFSSPLTTRRATVQVFDPTSTGIDCLVSCQSQSYLTIDGQSASLSWYQAPIWGLQQDLYYWSFSGLLMWGALSEERTGLSFTIAAGPCQRNHSCVRVTWDSWPYFTFSDSRLPQPGGPGSRIYVPQEQDGPVIPSGTGLRAPPHGRAIYCWLLVI
jgi:hypothetical protein